MLLHPYTQILLSLSLNLVLSKIKISYPSHKCSITSYVHDICAQSVMKAYVICSIKIKFDI